MAPMPSEFAAPRRLHPVSLIFILAGEAKTFALPAVLLFFGGGGSGDGWWRLFGALMIVPAAIFAVVRYLWFTYSYGDDELIVREGVLFKNERHIPYARIQNIDATQNVLHALFRVYSVSIETGGGAGAEASLNVLPEAALSEMRQHVFAKKALAPVEEPVQQQVEAPDVLLRLSLRDLAICGLVRGRGLLLLGAIVGAAFELGLDDVVFRTAEDPEARGPIASAVRAVIARGGSFDLLQIAAAVLFFVIMLALLRVMSVVYTMQRLYGFTLTHAGGELRMTYGLLTRVGATTPLRRIQAVTVREGPLHRLFGVTSVRADTAGGEANQQAAGNREWLAPILAREAMPAFVRMLLPGASIEGVQWQRAHPRAARRAIVPSVAVAIVSLAPVIWYFGVKGFAFAPIVLGLAVLSAVKQAASLGHAIDGNLFLFKSGWIWRHVTIAPLDKVQAVEVAETPFDRRHGMASLVVDTAGAAGAPHRLDVPFLDRALAVSLAGAIAGRASQSALNW